VRDRIRNSKRIEETVDAGYFQVEMTLIKHRLTLLTGVRYETTTDDAVGPLQDLGAAFVRNANGTFARNAAGQRIRKPEAGAVGSLEELRLTETDRGFQVSRHFDGYYPSLHLTYNLTENFLARAAYARSYGRPDFADILPTLMANEFDIDTTADPTAARGTIAVTNTGLKPWTANNFDLSLEYYTAQGGLVSVGAFQKQIVDFFGSSAKLATAEDLAELGLDPRYVGWQLTTKFNSGAARISGVEFNFRHSLRALGGWGRYFSAFANGTKLKLEGQNGADFSGFIPSSLNWGFNFNRAPYGFGARWSYLGPNRTAPIAAIGPDAYTYAQFKRPTLDLSVNYQLRANLALYANVKNATREPRLLRRYGSETPEYAKVFRYNNYGALFTVGLKGTY
jgi:TonB-dependent receptor